jgi:Fic family protein
MMSEGPGGFKGGLSAEKYIRITGASRATATRDLHDLVAKDALVRSGVLKATRYELNLPRSE